ncbi:hypothetical protein VTI74DRAFT_252 [Chaetomium olivicolor]
MCLSAEVWSPAPYDVTEMILDHHVESYFMRDPAYTWTHLRHTTKHQMRAIERRFRQFWLPKMSITLYTGREGHADYAFQNLDPSSEDMAIFSMSAHATMLPRAQEQEQQKHLHNAIAHAWGHYDPATNRNITVRLGEGQLNADFQGGYILNDTDLPGLQVLEPTKISFKWKVSINELLREEMYMRKVGDKMFDDLCKEWVASHPRPYAEEEHEHDEFKVEPGMPPLSIQVKLWKEIVQPGRRVAAIKHRVAKFQTTDRPLQWQFNAWSKHLYRQEPSAEIVKQMEGPHNYCPNLRTPDIFQVVALEESVIPHLKPFQRYLDHNMERDIHAKHVSYAKITRLQHFEYMWGAWIIQRKKGLVDPNSSTITLLRRPLNGPFPFAPVAPLPFHSVRVRWDPVTWTADI